MAASILRDAAKNARGMTSQEWSFMTTAAELGATNGSMIDDMVEVGIIEEPDAAELHQKSCGSPVNF